MSYSVQEPTEVGHLPWRGQLLGGLAALLGALFCLLPDSHSLLVSWPWVFLFQAGLFCLAGWGVWMLLQPRPFRNLGAGLDWAAALWAVALLLSVVWAQSPGQARFYGLSGLCYLVGLYALVNWLETPQRRWRLLVAQGWLSLAFILVSLALWGTQTLLPELSRLASLRPYGLDLPYDFNVPELRNWAPLGHQNYVAGYLMLALPLLSVLAALHRAQQRWLWAGGVVLGLVDLYTTNSRGGILGLGLLLVGFLLLPLPARWRGWGVGILAGLAAGFVAFNPRLQSLLLNLVSGRIQGEVAYRWITTQVGVAMAASQPLTGAGPGATLLRFQRYRPLWAGREAELAYQLHSTPVQAWAELGSLGGIAALVTLVLLIRALVQLQKSPGEKVLIWGLAGGLLAYGGLSLTDYQLDHPALAVPLLLNLAVLIAQMPEQSVPRRWRRMAAAGLGLSLLLGAVWLGPVDRAWQLSAQGFGALARNQVERFAAALEQASALAPWEPYYPFQLSWNLAQKGQIEASQRWFERATAQVAPDLEFGHSNLAWLLLSSGDAVGAMQHFQRSAQLVPAKRGVFYGLGLSLLAQQRTDLAVRALTLEVLRDPLFLTSPLWRTPGLRPLYPLVVTALQQRYAELRPNPGLTRWLQEAQAGLDWWLGKGPQVPQRGTPLLRKVLQLAQGQAVELQDPQTPGEALLAAWQDPQNRERFLQQAWIRVNRFPPSPEELAPLRQGLAASRSFEQWVKQYAPVKQYRRERSGFGVLSRHIDGPIPSDFLLVVDNVLMSDYLSDLLPSTYYLPDLDRALQPWRDQLLATLQ